jgi:ribosomal protein S18 acetylase RimI-like enzyme
MQVESGLSEFVARWIEDGDELALERARGFARAKLLDRSPLLASLGQKVIREHSRFREVLLGPDLVALAAVVDDLFGWRSVPVDASLPGAAVAALDGIERPYVAMAGEPIWSELERAGGQELFDEIQMARIGGEPLPEPEPRVVVIEDRAEFERAGFSVAEAHFQAGPFVALRDDEGEILSWGGVRFVTDRVAQLGYIGTREDRRCEGLARAVVAELVRRLETPERTLVLHVQPGNSAAIRLYGRLGFRGRRRVALFRFA